MRKLLLGELFLAVVIAGVATLVLRPGRAPRVATGTQGQRIVIAPAERLVVVRLGRSQDWETFDIRGLIRLVAEVNGALNRPPR